MYLLYTNSTVRYMCSDINYDNGNVKVTFENDFEACYDGFGIYLDNGKLLGDYSSYKTIADSGVDSLTFSKAAATDIEIIQEKTLGQKLVEAEKKIENLEKQLEVTNEALEQLIFDYMEEENTDE